MKSVLISINPKWCELIANGKKTIEVRKTMPKLELPFKCYIYCTEGKDLLTISNGKVNKPNEIVIDLTNDRPIYELNGKVIGEFICNGMMIPNDNLRLMSKQSCVPIDELIEYSKGKRLYGWRISNLVIYDKLKELRDFKPYNRKDCYYSHLGYAIPRCKDCHKCYVKRPPQSYMFIEDLGV